ncbi:MAG: hypothetical protein ACFBSC_09110 [Microcoleaceae cyanobacterium]
MTALLLGLFQTPSVAQGSSEFYSGRWPDRNGDYPIREVFHPTWQVVDTDPRGLNCRDGIPSVTQQRNVVAQFPENTLLNTVRGAEVELIEDYRGLPWLRVQLYGSDDPSFCWVRANEQFIVPIKAEVIP